MTGAAATKGTILITAGGTGGHLFPAEALASELGRRGWGVHLATDERADKYGKRFPAEAIHLIPSATLSAKNLAAMPPAGLKLLAGIVKAWRLVGRLKPKAVVGFGGYPTFPPMIAASLRGVPAILHEQNAVMGRANRAIAARVKAIAKSFSATEQMAAFEAKAHHTGNPVRDAVRVASDAAYDAPSAGGPFRLLVFGGSQGAAFFTDLVPPAIERLAGDLKARLVLTQQCRPEDLERARAAYAAMGVEADLAAFFTDLPARIAASHLVVSRSGASTVAELAVIGRPAILVPYAHALDADQAVNARVLAEAGGAFVEPQATLTPERLAERIGELMRAPDRLNRAASQARLQGRPDAVLRLASLVEAIATGEAVPD